MVTTIIFVGLLAVLGAGCYGVVRWVLMAHWNDWQQSRRERREDVVREQRKLALRYEALDSVLAQLGQTDEREREAA